MKVPALLFERVGGGDVRCGTCQRRCTVRSNRAGWCATRRNEGGVLYSLIYGEVSTLSVNPIEKKPVFHFHPGSRWLSLGSVGCNFRCPGCQNWEISHAAGGGRGGRGTRGTSYLSPEDAVATAKVAGCLGISWTFNEPALWLEYTLDTARAAKAAGLYTNYVTNGSMTSEALDLLAPVLDVFRVDVKGFSAATYRRIGHLAAFEGILDAARRAKQRGLHVEVVTNIIPGFNDADRELAGIAGWIREALGPGTPWHVTRFHPDHRLGDVRATPIATLERARTIGMEAGLWYVYLGNVPGHRWEHTYCHACGELLIQRFVFDVLANRIRGGCCPKCGARIPGVFGEGASAG